MSTILVTGGSGFIGSWCIVQLLQAGHSVRTTVRNLAREAEVRDLARAGGAEPGEQLSLHAADLTADAGWAEAVDGCDHVLHVASPFPPGEPKHEDELIVPAREGALRVLRASRAAGVKRVVLTSSFAAIGYGLPPQAKPFDETDWTNVDGPGVGAYAKSKTLAERAAWDFVKDGGGPELSVVNPVGVFGPVLGRDTSTSILLVQRLMQGAVPGLPRIWFGAVDVRDVADLHLRAMTDPAAKGERFLAVAGDFMTGAQIARALKTRLGPAAAKVPTRELPSFVVRLASIFQPELRLLGPELDKPKNGTSAKARRLLGWSPRPADEALAATAESLVKLGMLPG